MRELPGRRRKQMKIRTIKEWMVRGAVLLGLCGVVLGLAAQQPFTLNVTGQAGQAKVVQINGHSYVDIEALARITNGSISYQGNQITLTLPNGGGGPPSVGSAPASAPANPPANTGFSKDFITAGIEYMSQIREWRNTLANAIANGFPLSDELFQPYRDEAATSLRLAKLAASTDADRNAAQLIGSEFENMRNLTNKYLAKRANLDFIAPDALKNDSMNQQILACARSLAAMASANQFTDDGTCH
jgi:hypothetical protein